MRYLLALCVMTAWVLVNTRELAAETQPPPTIAVKQGVPEGFEELDQPRETAVDVHFGGVKIGSFRAVFTPKNVAFSDPEGIVKQIPSVKHEFAASIQKALTGELATHASLICAPIPAEGCGRLSPETAGVIFNENKFRADIFVNAAMLELQDTSMEKVLPPAPDILSAVHTFNGGFVGTQSTPENYSLLSNSIFAYGAGRIDILAFATTEERRINNLSAGLDKWGLDTRLGFFETYPLRAIGQFAMSGISVGTSLNTNLALRNAIGNQLTIFLPQRSYVSLIHNNVIYSTDFYEAGNQVLNTNSLPDGAYEVTLRIRDTSGTQTEERRFFAKDFNIPPSDRTIYHLQAGALRDMDHVGTLPKPGDTPVATAGFIQRIGEATGVDMNALVIKDQFFAEAGAFTLLPGAHQVRLSLIGSSSQDIGASVGYLGYLLDKNLSVSSSLRMIRSGEKALAADPVDPINESVSEASAVVSYRPDEMITLGLQGNYMVSNHSPQYAYGPTLNVDFWRDSQSSLSLSANTTLTHKEVAHGFFMRFSRKIGDFNYESQTSAEQKNSRANSEQAFSKAGAARITWNDDKTPGRLNVVGAQISRQERATTYSADLDHRSRWGNLKLLGHQTQERFTSNQFYSGNMGFSIAHTTEDIAWGGNQQNVSGVIIKNSGNAEKIPMKIMMNNSEIGRFDTGSALALLMSPYQSYKVSIAPVESAAIDYDGSVKNVTLYPGNIVPLIWDINKVHVVLGRVVLPDGTPLVNAKLEEARNITVTDEGGLFQAEVLNLGHMTFKRAASVVTISAPPTTTIKTTPALPTPSKLKDTPGMSQQEQAAAILDIFGPQDKPLSALPELPPPLTSASSPPAEEARPAEKKEENTPTASVVPPEVKELPEVRCRVTLKDPKEENGIYIFPTPLTCDPIPLEKETSSDQEKPPAEGDSQKQENDLQEQVGPTAETKPGHSS